MRKEKHERCLRMGGIAKWNNPQWRGAHLHSAGGSTSPMVDAAFSIFASDLEAHLFFCVWALRARYVVSVDLGQFNTLACTIIDVSLYPETGTVTVVDTYVARNTERKAHRVHYGRKALEDLAEVATGIRPKRDSPLDQDETETLNRFGTIIGEKIFHSRVAGEINRRIPKDGQALPLFVVGDAGTSAPGVSSGAAAMRLFLEQTFHVATASEFMTSSACAGCGTRTRIVKPGAAQVSHCRSMMCSSHMCPIFSGLIRKHINRRGEDCNARMAPQMFHRDLASCLGIWVHFAHRSLGIDLPAHYQRPSAKPVPAHNQRPSAH
jgi:hypothetical protein